MLTNNPGKSGPRTEALRRALLHVQDEAAVADLRFLEDWQNQRYPGVAACLRASQIRRANPELAAQIRAELAPRAPLASRASPMARCARGRAREGGQQGLSGCTSRSCG